MKFLFVFVVLNVSVLTCSKAANPWKILDVTAYSSFKDITQKYNELVKIAGKDKEQISALRSAYEKIKEKRGITKNVDDNYPIKMIVDILSLLILLYILLRLQFNFMIGLTIVLRLFASFSLWSITLFHVYDMFIDDFIEDDTGAIKFLFSVGGSYLITYLYKKYTKRKEDLKDKESDENEEDEGSEEEKEVEESNTEADITSLPRSKVDNYGINSNINNSSSSHPNNTEMTSDCETTEQK